MDAPGRGAGTGQMLAAAAASIPCTSAAFAELSSEILRAGVAIKFRAHGDSMRPLVRDGDVLLVRPVDGRPVRVGDLVLCSSGPGRVVVHRVVRTLAGPGGIRYTIQGDQVAQPDGTIPRALIYGRVAAIERGRAPIDLDRSMMRWLGWCAALRSRCNLGRGRPSRLARRLFGRLPGFSRYLA